MIFFTGDIHILQQIVLMATIVKCLVETQYPLHIYNNPSKYFEKSELL